MPTRGNPLKIPEIIEGQVSDKEYSQKVTVVGDILYFAVAPVGSSQSAAVWRVKKIDTTGGNILVTWADSDEKFDNIATDLTTLTYG
jgi:hypothetical protein